MKKTTFAMALFIGASLTSLNLFAQSTAESSKKVSFGLRAGLNIPSIGGDYKNVVKAEGLNTKSKVGFHAGAILDICINKWLYLQPGLYLTAKGTKAEGTTMIGNFLVKGVFNGNPMYLQVPVLLSNRFDLGEDIKWHLNYGIYFAYGVGGKMKQEYSIPGYSQKAEVKIDFFGDSNDSFGFNRFDTGIVLGTGFSFSRIYLGIQYEMGLVNVANDKYWVYDSGGNPSFKMNNFTISAGYNF